MTLDQTLREDLMDMVVDAERPALESLIDQYQGKFFTGSITKGEVALFSLMVSAALKPGCTKKCADFIAETFLHQ